MLKWRRPTLPASARPVSAWAEPEPLGWRERWRRCDELAPRLKIAERTLPEYIETLPADELVMAEIVFHRFDNPLGAAACSAEINRRLRAPWLAGEIEEARGRLSRMTDNQALTSPESVSMINRLAPAD